MADYERSDYGYWISPEGVVHPLRDERHVIFASRQLGREAGGEGVNNDDWRADLLDAGWTRVAVHHREFVVQMPTRPVAPAAVRVLSEMIRETHQARRYPIYVQDHLTGRCAGGRTIVPGDPTVLIAWHRLLREREAWRAGETQS